MIRTRLQGDTPFFPNMLNNGKVEICLKEDVDKALAEKDEEISVLRGELNACNKNAGCHYCNYGEPLWKSRLESVVIGKNPQTRKPSLKLGHSFSLPIEYCPKCGRKL